MRSMRTVSLVLVFALATPALPVLADDTAAAETLFKEGKALMEQGKYAEACPKLEASLAYDRAAGGTILRLAACYQGMKKWASAWGKYNDALTRAKQQNRPERVEAATKGIAEVEPNMSRLAIRVDAGARAPGLEVKLDGVPVPEGAWATATPIDPGPHTVVATAPGHKPWETKLTISVTAETKSIDVPKLDAAPAAGTSSAASETRSGKTAGYVAIGTGVVLFGAGIGLYFKARAERDQYFEDCKTQPVIVCDDPNGRSRVRTWETLAFVAGGVGLAAVGIGVTLLVTGKPSEAKPAAARIVATPTIAATGGGVSLLGEF